MVTQAEIQKMIANARKAGAAAANKKKKGSRSRRKRTHYIPLGSTAGVVAGIDALFGIENLPDFIPGKQQMNAFANQYRQKLASSNLPYEGMTGALTSVVTGGVFSKAAAKLAPQVRIAFAGYGVRP